MPYLFSCTAHVALVKWVLIFGHLLNLNPTPREFKPEHLLNLNPTPLEFKPDTFRIQIYSIP